LDIPNENVIFVGGWKKEYFKDNLHGIKIHVDDYHFELEGIKKVAPEVWCIPCDLRLFFDDLIKEFN